ncbi:hypothetical protein [Bacillus sp. FJAT-28004]|uniref:hypothetical protein n=1 Tax=Bacillus sp. FJAT-28004 TaxID=1679165 RepID=UPI0006B612E4|nr:hypothetical protein [Bacillus sp. FJAT-28004]
MRFYIVYDMIKTVIEFINDPKTDKKQVLDLIRELGLKGQQDADILQLYMLIIRGLQFLERFGLQEAFKTYFKTHREDGLPYTIMLVKELRDHIPLIEFRVNWQGIGAFRAVFFEHQMNEQQILFFVKAVVKNRTFDSEFERIVQETESMYSDFLTHPEKYQLNLVGDGQID